VVRREWSDAVQLPGGRWSAVCGEHVVVQAIPLAYRHLLRPLVKASRHGLPLRQVGFSDLFVPDRVSASSPDRVELGDETRRYNAVTCTDGHLVHIT
jgi:hypothetical protein